MMMLVMAAALDTFAACPAELMNFGPRHSLNGQTRVKPAAANKVEAVPNRRPAFFLGAGCIWGLLFFWPF